MGTAALCKYLTVNETMFPNNPSGRGFRFPREVPKFLFPQWATPLEYGIGFGTLETHALLVPYRIDGIVVAQENEEVLLEAWRQEEQLLIEKQMKVWLHIAGPIPHEENIH